MRYRYFPASAPFPQSVYFRTSSSLITTIPLDPQYPTPFSILPSTGSAHFPFLVTRSCPSGGVELNGDEDQTRVCLNCYKSLNHQWRNYELMRQPEPERDYKIPSSEGNGVRYSHMSLCVRACGCGPQPNRPRGHSNLAQLVFFSLC